MSDIQFMTSQRPKGSIEESNEAMLRAMEETKAHHEEVARNIGSMMETLRSSLNMNLPYKGWAPQEAVIDYLKNHPERQLRVSVRNAVIEMGCSYKKDRKEASVTTAITLGVKDGKIGEDGDYIWLIA